MRTLGGASVQWETEGCGYVIGYNYHGGHTNTPWAAVPGSTATWLSPRRLTDSSSLDQGSLGWSDDGCIAMW